MLTVLQEADALMVPIVWARNLGLQEFEQLNQGHSAGVQRSWCSTPALTSGPSAGSCPLLSPAMTSVHTENGFSTLPSPGSTGSSLRSKIQAYSPPPLL